MENIDLGKSANQIWKESGSTLSFKNWLQREKDKGHFLPNKQLLEFNSVDGNETEFDSIINRTLDDFHLKNKPKAKAGLNPVIIWGSVALILGGIAYKIYQNKSK